MKHQKLTPDTLDKFIKENVECGLEPTFINLEMPTNLDEFKEFTKNIYGVELSVYCLAYPKGALGDGYACQYEIQGMEATEYNKLGLMPLWNKKFGRYNGLKVLLNSCFGNLSCGGVGIYHYGQTKCDKQTWLRIKNWDKNNEQKVLKNQLDQANSLKEILGGTI